ncbi:MAG: glyceraldehyde 3-phosphate dehydrogenase NAD-binding domain-containing protein [Candidatus Woesearchaeota archaeon]
MKTIGINGIAGRIGKFTAYELVKLGEVIGAVNDLASTDAIVKALHHVDGVHGKLEWGVAKVNDENLMINGHKVRVYHEADPANIEWGKDVYAVAECTGRFIQKEDAEKHFNKSPKLEDVVISAPGKGDIKMLVMGINHTDYEKGDRVTSNASCTTKALAMPIKVLMDADIDIYGVLMDTTHAATNTSKPLDFMSEYGVLDNIISAKTGAAIATGKVIPSLEGKMDGFAMRVPTRDGSFANIYLVAEADNLSVEYLNGIFESAAENPDYCNRIQVFDGKEIASADIIGNISSSVIALSKTKSIALNPAHTFALVGIVSGYDNERGPAKDLALLTQYIAGVGK